MVISLPPLNWLRVFEAAARQESFARAAAELNMSAAAVSQQVRALEDRLGAALFTRQAHGVTLTDRGRAYMPGVQHALQALAGATEGIFGAAQTRPLYVQSTLIFAHGILAPGYGEFAATHGDVALVLNTANQTADYQHSYSDMQIVFGDPTPFGGDAERLMGEVLYPVARADIAQAIGRAADLTEYPLIEVGTHRAGWPYVLEALAVPPSGARPVMVDNTLMAMALARQGVGIALARSPASDVAQAEAGLVPCLEGVCVPGREAYHLICPDSAALRPEGRAFRGWLQARSAAMAPPVLTGDDDSV